MQGCRPEHNRITPKLFFLDVISICQVQQDVMSRTYDWKYAGGPEVK